MTKLDVVLIGIIIVLGSAIGARAVIHTVGRGEAGIVGRVAGGEKPHQTWKEVWIQDCITQNTDGRPLNSNWQDIMHRACEYDYRQMRLRALERTPMSHQWDENAN